MIAAMKHFAPVLLLLAVLSITGCADYYRHVRIVDTATNETYYARYATNSRLGMSFRDARTGQVVRINEATEVFEMSEEDFKKAIAE